MTRLYIVTCLLNLYAEYIVRNARLNHKLKSRLLVEISTTSDMWMKALKWQKVVEELKSLSMKVKEESEKAGLKLNIKKTKIMESSPITSWQIDREKNGSSDRLYFLGLQENLHHHCRW